MKKIVAILIGLSFIFLSSGLSSAEVGFSDKVPFPEGYRNWHYLKSMVIQEGHPLYSIVPGLHHIYLNEIAYKHFRSGSKREYPQGSIMVFELFDVETGKNSITTTKTKAVLVKQRDPRFAQTGGWGWELFVMPTKERAVMDVDRQCANCHFRSEETHDTVWQKWEAVKEIVE